MPAPAAFGGSPILAIFQGTKEGTSITTYSAWNVSVSSTGVGNLLCELNTGSTDNNILAQVTQYGGTILECDITYATLVQSDTFLDGTNQIIAFAFKNSGETLTDPPGLFNIVFYQCFDGIDDTP